MPAPRRISSEARYSTNNERRLRRLYVCPQGMQKPLLIPVPVVTANSPRDSRFAPRCPLPIVPKGPVLTVTLQVGPRGVDWSPRRHAALYPQGSACGRSHGQNRERPSTYDQEAPMASVSTAAKHRELVSDAESREITEHPREIAPVRCSLGCWVLETVDPYCPVIDPARRCDERLSGV